MPILRSLTLKIKTTFSPPSSPITTSPSSSFEAVGRKERQRERAQTTNGSMESITSQEGAEASSHTHAKVVLEGIEKVRQERGQRRMSRFREEL
ncbi:hypothetical protein K458DRAFT_416947 [Lentithecium fluviatile CBS 122367]|uniref:Uncharacterized protein n=1 Tax=Lentithecium fluviatile CBS 122367 TaxID=1168545 RepID=A0A6G1J5D9_9PLEO|nr:hypothetical protein K458DRAFT_416947 [Lentithecium fluviatile CBS 122367]